MTREDSIRARTWVTEDGRYLTVSESAHDHLCAIRGMLREELTPGYDETRGREIAADFVARPPDDDTIDLDLDVPICVAPDHQR